jgi:hypothetical protein
LPIYLVDLARADASGRGRHAFGPAFDIARLRLFYGLLEITALTG